MEAHPAAVQMNICRSAEARLLMPEDLVDRRMESGDSDDSFTLIGLLIKAAASAREGFEFRSTWQWTAVFKILLPSFMLQSTRAQHKLIPSKLRPTSYLNGVRGFACVFIFIGHVWVPYVHHATENGGNLENGFSATIDDYHIIQFPIIRVVYSGTLMVSVFFILSGFVLSIRPLQLLRACNYDALLKNLSDAAFRRIIRLFGPLIIPHFTTALVIYCGYYGNSPAGTEYVQARDSLWQQLSESYYLQKSQANPFRWDYGGPPNLIHLWSLPIEYRCSLMVYIIVLAMAQVKPLVRRILLPLFVWYLMTIRRWEVANFIIGMILAELSLVRIDSIERGFEFSLTQYFRKYISAKYLRLISSIFWSLLLSFALWIGTYPASRGEETWYYQALSPFTPSMWAESAVTRRGWWVFWGSFLLMLALENHAPLQRPFKTTIAQYLGKISFSLYIVHVPLALTVNRWIPQIIFAVIPSYVLGFFMAMLAVTIVTIWVSDVFWRLIDLKTIQFSKDLRKWCTV